MIVRATRMSLLAHQYCVIPKLGALNSVNDFWPISCCNTVSICISKLLAQGLKLLLTLSNCIPLWQEYNQQTSSCTWDDKVVSKEVYLRNSETIFWLVNFCYENPRYYIMINCAAEEYFYRKRALWTPSVTNMYTVHIFANPFYHKNMYMVYIFVIPSFVLDMEIMAGMLIKG